MSKQYRKCLSRRMVGPKRSWSVSARLMPLTWRFTLPDRGDQSVSLAGTYTKETFMAQTDFRTTLQGSNEIEITVTGRTSGRSLTYPIWFALDGKKLYLIPVKGSDTDWYKNVRKRPSIRLEARGKTFT